MTIEPPVDLSQLEPYFALATAIGAIATAIGVYLMHRKKKPNLIISCEGSYWQKRQPTSVVTTVTTLLLFENTGQINTTVKHANLSLEYKGMQYQPIQSEAIDSLVEAGASKHVGVDFQIPISTLANDDIFQNGKLQVTHIFGTSKTIEIREIKHYEP
jgi:hypothetical protein